MATPSTSDAMLGNLLDVALATPDSTVVRGRNLSGCWPLPPELTLKVLSMMDTRSVCLAAATCKLFRDCSSDPLCYVNLDFTRSSVDSVTDQVVYCMIQRAGKDLQSLKLDCFNEDNALHHICLAPLWWDEGAAGTLLRQLHLYNLHMPLFDSQVCAALSACPSLVELKIVGLDFRLINVLVTIHKHCHSIKRLHLEIHADNGSSISNSEACELEILIKNCSLLSSLAIRGYGIEDDLLSVLVKGAHGLKSLDLLGSHTFSGNFLSDPGIGGAANCLETLILRECEHLKADAVSFFLKAVLRGDWKALRYVDISNSQGLVHRYNWTECTRCSIDVSTVVQGRPDIHLIVDYPQEIYFYDCMSPPSPRSRSLAYSNMRSSGRGNDAAASSAQLRSSSGSGSTHSSLDAEDAS